MAQETRRNGHKDAHPMSGHGNTPYEKAVLGFRNYWYPVCQDREITERKPKSMRLLGDEVVFLRRDGKVYALADECPHRGTRLSRGKHEFPGTPTIACRYHGWVFDVTNGTCVAALTDGPDSPVVGKVRVKTYPVEVRKGIVWIWMGKMAPVPVEEDIPPMLLREDTWLDIRPKVVPGNWRWHAENVGLGHAFMLHRDSIHILTTQLPAHAVGAGGSKAEIGEDGEWLWETIKGVEMQEQYGDLGQWPRRSWRPWRRKGDVKVLDPKTHRPRHVGGVVYPRVGLRLPGVTRITQAPMTGGIYYEWYVPIDEGTYIYFQVATYWIKNPWDSFWFRLKYFLYGRPAQLWRFNEQDKAMVGDSTDYANRHGFNWPSPLYGPDALSTAWRKMCNETARGEDVLPAKPEPKAEEEKVPAATAGS